MRLGRSHLLGLLLSQVDDLWERLSALDRGCENHGGNRAAMEGDPD